MKKRWPYCQWFWARRTDFVHWMHNDAHIQTLCTRIVYRRDWCTLAWRFYEILAWRFVSKIKHCKVNVTGRLVTSVPHRISQQAVLVCVRGWNREGPCQSSWHGAQLIRFRHFYGCSLSSDASKLLFNISPKKYVSGFVLFHKALRFFRENSMLTWGTFFSRILTRLPSPATPAKRCCLHVGRDVLQGFGARAACHCTEHLCVSWLFIGGLLCQEYTNASVKQSLEVLCMSFCDARLWEWIVLWGVKLQRYISCDIWWKVLSCACICSAACSKGKSKMDFLARTLGIVHAFFSKAVRSLESSEVCIVALRDRRRFVLQRCTEKLHDCIAAEERGSFLPWVANPKIVVGRYSWNRGDLVVQCLIQLNYIM